MRVLAALAIALAAAASSATACAQGSADAASASDAEVTARLAFLDLRLDRATAAADRWWYGWLTTHQILTVGQAAFVLATRDKGLREDFAVGAFAASIGVLGVGAAPFPARTAAAELRATSQATPEARRAKLARAERLLERSAKAERFGRSWIAHAAAVVVSTATGLVLALGYHRVTSGAVQIGAGVALAEVQIATQPTAAIDDLRDYRARFPARPAHSAPTIRGGLNGLTGTF
ncbi:MAG TPA: hypothetical protein VGM56_10730 [Byssovorax sp.]